MLRDNYVGLGKTTMLFFNAFFPVGTVWKTANTTVQVTSTKCFPSDSSRRYERALPPQADLWGQMLNMFPDVMHL